MKHDRPGAISGHQTASRPRDPETSGALAQSVMRAAHGHGVEIDAEAARLLADHVAEVYEANAVLNLTRIPKDDAAELHVGDSLDGLRLMELGGPGPWADIGSGAGFPGVPLGIVSGRRMTLVESIGKKARFLEHVALRLRLDVVVLASRAEDAANEHRGEFAAVSARALSALPSLVELASPLLVDQGVLVCWKGEPTADEIARGDRAAKLVGMTRVETARVSAGVSDAARNLVVYRKVGRPTVRLPRRSGMAQRSPLA